MLTLQIKQHRENGTKRREAVRPDRGNNNKNGSVPNTREESVREETHSSSNSHDSENLNNVKDHDEVRDFVDARYVGPVEAVWRILSKNLQNKSHSINPSLLKGARSFEDLRTINGILCDTFTSACLTAGLIEDDQEWRRTLNEAIVWMMPRQLRCLFVRMLIHCQPLRPEELWNEFKKSMSEDYNRRFGVEEGEKKAYVFINSMLNREGYSLSDFPSMIQISEIDEALLSSESLQTNNLDDPQTYYNKLNVRQKEVVDYILNSINENKNVCTMAYTGIAATLLPNGKTVHKTFGLPVPMFSDSSSRIKPNSKQGEYLKNVDVFIWDEAPMSPRYALEIIDRTLRHIMNNEMPFGGKLMILGGDFRQLLPVQPHATRTETVNLSIKFSSLWKNFHQFSLTQNMRALPEEIQFVNFLLNIGDGTVNNLNDEVNLPDSCFTSNNNDIVENIYGKMIRDKRYDQLTSAVILSARNVDVDEINKQVVELLDPSTQKNYTGVDSTENCDNGNMDDAVLPEYLNTLNPPNFPPYELQLRQYSIVMLIRNLNLSEGLCNGTRLMVLELGVNVLRCKILTGDKAGEIVFINRLTLYCENTYPFTFKRRQFPIKIAFCMTINKSQGQTFEKIGVDLIKDVFNHGQLYVAFSRVRSWSALTVSLAHDKLDKVVKNIVYKEIFA
ncbi:ATP-dependent DNA helicase PIF1-like [Cotesia glomerata]|uniref:ATP-dependent DNA helicase PIF1-like n=1 Tax=Cotesia glomerata TaxID=32391 RepID=UPI001D021522|nr:ATP-dependent DNA helicase PIF1-like [Cotesia glomerata]